MDGLQSQWVALSRLGTLEYGFLGDLCFPPNASLQVRPCPQPAVHCDTDSGKVAEASPHPSPRLGGGDLLPILL